MKLELVFLALLGLSLMRGIWSKGAALGAIFIVALAYLGIEYLEKANGLEAKAVMLLVLACGLVWLQFMGVPFPGGSGAKESSGGNSEGTAANKPFSTSSVSGGDADGETAGEAGSTGTSVDGPAGD